MLATAVPERGTPDESPERLTPSETPERLSRPNRRNDSCPQNHPNG